jgi:inosine-uridine nucleoside N-ribohydrolase
VNTICAAIDESVLRDVRLKRVDVDFGGSISDGMTVVDPRVKEFNPRNVHIALDADRERFVNMMYAIIGGKA